MRTGDENAQRHSYDIAALDSGAEMKRLEQQVDLVRTLEKPYLERLELSRAATVVDLGCGPGYMSRVLASMVPQGSLVGVDVSPELLVQAQNGLREDGLSNGSFVRAWAHHLPLAGGIADLVYARFLMQHLPDPVAVLREARRVSKPGACTVIVDTDDGALVVHPELPGLRRLIEASQESQRRVGGDRHVGRKLRGYLIAAGYEDVRVDVSPFTSDMVGMDRFLDIAVGYKRQIIAPDLMSPSEVDAALTELKGLDSARGAFAHALGYAACGRAPRHG